MSSFKLIHPFFNTTFKDMHMPHAVQVFVQATNNNCKRTGEKYIWLVTTIIILNTKNYKGKKSGKLFLIQGRCLEFPTLYFKA